MANCCVRSCENNQTEEYRIKGGKGPFRKPLTYIVHICETCHKALVGKPVDLTYYQCGSLAFVHEIWEEDSDA